MKAVVYAHKVNMREELLLLLLLLLFLLLLLLILLLILVLVLLLLLLFLLLLFLVILLLILLLLLIFLLILLLVLPLLLLLLLSLALQPAVDFGLSNKVLLFFSIRHQLSPSSHSQHLKISSCFLFPSFPRSSPLPCPFQFLSEDLFGYSILLHSLQVTYPLPFYPFYYIFSFALTREEPLQQILSAARSINNTA